MDAWINPETRDYEAVQSARLEPGRYDYTVDRIATFRRPSAATYFSGSAIATVGADVPRFEGGKLLLESASKNELLNSESSAGWLNNTPNTPIPVALLGLNGTLLINQSVAGDAPHMNGPAAVPAGATFTGSFLVDLSTCTSTTIKIVVLTIDADGVQSGSGTYTIASGALVIVSAGANVSSVKANVTQVSGAVYRFSATATFAKAGAAPRVYCSTNVGGTQVVAGAPQIEYQAAASSYIPTGATATTREADDCVVILSDVMGPVGGLLRAPGNGLANAAYLRLMTPLGSWFGDITLGSRLHELQREKDLPRVKRLALQYSRSALQPLLADGRAKSIEIQALRNKDATAGGRLLLDVAIVDAIGDRQTFRFPVRVA